MRICHFKDSSDMITINWEAVSAIATSVACIIALWQTHVAYKKKLKFSFDDNVIVMNGEKRLEVVKLTICNVGNRSVEITGWGLLLRNDVGVQFSPPLQEWAFLGGVLPKVVEVGRSMSLYFEKTSFLFTINAQQKEGNIKRRDKLKIFVYDSGCTRHVIKTSKRCKDFLEACNNPKGT